MKKTLITGSNFAKKADIIFTQEIHKSEYTHIKSNNHYLIKQNDKKVCYLNKNFVLHENDIIFCKTDYLNFLFKLLKKNKKLKNIKLITSQSDRKISRNLYSKKPECISKWFAVNTLFENDILKSLPLGLANDFSEKNLHTDDFINFSSFSKDLSGVDKVYANFNENTNYFFRSKVNSNISKSFFYEKIESTTLSSYKDQLKEYKYVLCPPGNGLDTHRIWEALYSNSVPVIFKNYYMPYLNNLPCIVIDNIADLDNKDKYKNFLTSNKTKYIESSFVEWWIERIRGNEKNTTESITIQISSLQINLFLFQNSIKNKILSFKKTTITFCIRLVKKVRRIVY